MPNIKSAKKRVRVAAAKTAVNKNFKSAMRTDIKKANSAIETGAADKSEAVRVAIKTTGRAIYDSVDKLAKTMRVKEIITVPVMENLSRTDEQNGKVGLMGIIVNLADYNIGADKGGAVNMFDDFDIDYNAQKYLIETRCSGALTKPYSAIALEVKLGE